MTTFPATWPEANRRRLDDLIRRVFGAPFGRVFRPAFGPAVSAAGAVLILHDQFTDTNGVTLPNHTIAPVNTVGASWAATAGSFNIQSNQAIPVNDIAAPSVATVSSGLADCTINATVTVLASSATGQGVYVRYNATGPVFWKIDLSYAVQQIRIFEGAAIGRATVAFTVVLGVAYPLVVTLSGNVITAAVGATSVSYTSATGNTNTIHGIFSRGVTYGKLDEFKIYTL